MGSWLLCVGRGILPVPAKPIDDVIVNGAGACLGFEFGLLVNVFGDFERDGANFHHVGYTVGRGLETPELQGAGCTRWLATVN